MTLTNKHNPTLTLTNFIKITPPTYSGSTFCAVAKIKNISQELFLATLINQLWNGAAPNLILNLIKINKSKNPLLLKDVITTTLRKIAEANP
jgi:hypothetical protein